MNSVGMECTVLQAGRQAAKHVGGTGVGKELGKHITRNGLCLGHTLLFTAPQW